MAGKFWRENKVAGDIEDDIKKRKSAKFENEMSKFCLAIIYPFYNISSSKIAARPILILATMAVVFCFLYTLF
jgi:hypothetical protein